MVRQLEFRIPGVVVKTYSGAKVKTLEREVENLKTIIELADVIYLHVGTNNIEKDSIQTITSQVQNLITKVQQMNSRAIVGWSAILPRPRDEFNTHDKVITVNTQVGEWCDKTRRPCLRSFSPVTKYGWARREFFSTTDRLHLNKGGVQQWVNFLKHQISSKSIRTLMNMKSKARNVPKGKRVYKGKRVNKGKRQE